MRTPSTGREVIPEAQSRDRRPHRVTGEPLEVVVRKLLLLRPHDVGAAVDGLRTSGSELVR